MGTNVIPVIVKWEGGKRSGNAILFFPTYDVNNGNIGCYAHMGQHSKAAMDYYHSCRNIPLADTARQDEARALVKEYARCTLESGEALKIVRRDTPRYKRQRYGGLYG